MVDYLLASKPYYLWLALALPVFSSLFLISKIDDFSAHFVVSNNVMGPGSVLTIDPNGL